MKRFVLAVLATILFGLTVSVGSTSAALRDVCANPNTANSTVCTDSVKADGSPLTEDPISGAHGTLIRVTRGVALVAGIAAIIIMLIAAIQYITSNGDSNNIKKAKETILYGLIGLVVIALAQSLIEYIVTKL